LKLPVSKENHQRSKSTVNYYDFFMMLSDLTDRQDVLVADAGSHWYLLSQAFKVKKGQRVILSGGLGTMGFALPCATGLSSANAKRVICISGDGSTMTALHEMAVFKANNLNIKLIIINNDGYASIRNTQNSYFEGRLVATGPESGLIFNNFKKIAESLSIPYQFVGNTKKLKNGIEKAFNSNGPFILEIKTDRIQQIIPTVTSSRNANGILESRPLDEMAPLLDPKVIKNL